MGYESMKMTVTGNGLADACAEIAALKADIADLRAMLPDCGRCAGSGRTADGMQGGSGGDRLCPSCGGCGKIDVAAILRVSSPVLTDRCGEVRRKMEEPRPDGAYVVPALTPEKMEELRNAAAATYRGPVPEDSIKILEPGMHYKAMDKVCEKCGGDASSSLYSRKNGILCAACINSITLPKSASVSCAVTPARSEPQKDGSVLHHGPFK